jgi:hypothetical protein
MTMAEQQDAFADVLGTYVSAFGIWMREERHRNMLIEEARNGDPKASALIAAGNAYEKALAVEAARIEAERQH